MRKGDLGIGVVVFIILAALSLTQLGNDLKEENKQEKEDK